MKLFNLDSEAHLGTCRRNVFACIAISIIILSIYSNTLDASWQFDDELNILKEKSLHLNELTWEGTKKIFLFTPDERKKIYGA